MTDTKGPQHLNKIDIHEFKIPVKLGFLFFGKFSQTKSVKLIWGGTFPLS